MSRTYRSAPFFGRTRRASRGLQVLLIIAVLLLVCVASAQATTYYIDYAAGSDSNNGTSKTTPWKHLPGMQGTTSGVGPGVIETGPQTGPGYQPGDNYILKGGVTWPAAALPMQAINGGSGSSTSAVGCAGSGCIYIGVDPTWYTGGSWTPPIFDGGATETTAYPGGDLATVDLYGGYFIFDSIEMKGWWQTSDGVGDPTWAMITPRGVHTEIKNSYFHGWGHSGTATHDDGQIIGGGASCPPDMTSSVHDNVADGSDTSGDMLMFIHPGVGYVYNNYVADIHNGVVGSPLYVFNNTFLNILGSFDPTSHGNVVESTGCQLIIYNNYSNNAGGGSSIFHTPVDGTIDYDFGNVFTGQQDETIQIDNNGLSTGAGAGIYVFNNTLQSPPGFSGAPIDGPSRTGYPNLPFMTTENNHLIADNPTVNFEGHTTTETDNNETERSNAQATADGYIFGSAYPYQPPNGGLTIGAGANLASLCSGIPSTATAPAATACVSDTTVGVGYNATNHTVIVPNRATLPHPGGSGAWDTGAYQYGVGGSSPGMGLTPSPLAFGNQVQSTASPVHTITLTSTGSAALTIATLTLTGTNSADFSQMNGCPVGSGSLAPSATCPINVTFTPSATGARSASVSISDNAGGHTIALGGTGIASGGVGGGGGGAIGGAKCPICFSEQIGIQNQAYTYVAGGGTANTQTATLAPAPLAYAAGQSVFWMPNAANTTGAPTLNVNGLGNKTIVKVGGSALSASPPDLTTTAIAWAIYDGTNFELQNPQTIPASSASKVCSQVAIAMPTGAISSAAKSSSATGTCTGLTTSDTVTCSSAVEAFSVTGFVPSTGGILTINPWPTANTINVEYENDTAGTITPGALTVNCSAWR